MRPHPFLPILLVAALPVLAGAAETGLPPPGLAGLPPPGMADPALAGPPEPPLPPKPPVMPLAPLGPVVTAPDPHDLLTECKDSDFIDCIRAWKPPPPPPEEPKKEAAKPPEPSPPDPKAPREPAQPGGNMGGTPPAPNPQADRAMYDALVKALKDSGLDGKVALPDPPQDGTTTLELDPKKAPRKP